MSSEDSALVAKETRELTKEQSPVTIQNLIISKAEREIIALGDTDSFIRYTAKLPVKSIIWNEDHLIAVTDDKRVVLAYKPELTPTTEMFFVQQHKRRETNDGRENIRVWEGEYEPIEFTKGNLIKFLKAHSEGADPKIIDAIKNLKVIDKISTHESLIELDGGDYDDNNQRTVEEETSVSNIPNKFTLRLPIVSTFSADMLFEARVMRSQSDGYNNPNKGKRVIQLRVINARQVMRDLMQAIMAQIPDSVPKYYGKMSLKENDSR